MAIFRTKRANQCQSIGKVLKEKDEVVLQALGWLAREDKIDYTVKNRRTFVSLVEGELRAFNSVVYNMNEQALINGSGNGS